MRRPLCGNNMHTSSVCGTPKKILIIRREEIGDLVCTLPLIHAIRLRFPDGYIVCLANAYTCQILDRNLDLDAVFVYEKKKHCPSAYALIRSFWKRAILFFKLLTIRFDYVVLASTHFESKDIRFARSLMPKHIVAFTDKNKPYYRGVDVPIPYVGRRHIVEELADLGKAFGISTLPSALRVSPDMPTVARISTLVELAGIRETDLVGFPISSRNSGRRWPNDKIVATLRTLHERDQCAFMLFATSQDAADAQAISDALAGLPVMICPTPELKYLIAGFSLCSCVICVEGGALHLAVALEKPVVGLFRNTGDAVRWAPWQIQNVLIRSDSATHVESISVESVVTAFCKLRSKTVSTASVSDCFKS